MGKPVFTASKAGSAAYFNALNEYMEDNVLHPNKGFYLRARKGVQRKLSPRKSGFLSRATASCRRVLCPGTKWETVSCCYFWRRVWGRE